MRKPAILNLSVIFCTFLHSWACLSAQTTHKLEILNENRTRRSFQLVVGLREGYDSPITHSAKEAEAIIAEWLVEQQRDGNPYLPGQLIEGSMLYIHNGIRTEPVFTYMGEVSPLYHTTLQDEEAIEALCTLAERLARELKQVRIYLSYRDQLLILEKPEFRLSRSG